MSLSISKVLDEGKQLIEKIKNNNNNTNNNPNKDEQKKRNPISILSEDDKVKNSTQNTDFYIVDNKRDLKELKSIIDRYKCKFSSEDKMKIDTLIYCLNLKI